MTDKTTEVVSLDDRRPPVTYTVRLKQWWDGRMAIWVQDVADSQEDRRRVAAALRKGADMIEDSALGDKHGQS